MDELVSLYSTFPTRGEAISAARTLLEQRLIACANVIGHVTSLYHWEDSFQQESEVIMLAKTTSLAAPEAMEALAKLHPYDTPCIAAFSAESCLDKYLQWVKQETALA